MNKKIMLNKHRIKEALEFREKTITWLATVTVQTNGRIGCDKATLMNYIRDGFTQQSADSVAEALGVTVRWLKSGLGL